MAQAFKTFRLASGRSFDQVGDAQVAKALPALGRALYKEAQGILASSQGLVPVDTGALRSSGYVAEPAYEGEEVTVVLGYGGPAAKINPKTGESTDAYALWVHENMDAYHKVGTAKYLEMPFDQATTGMAARVADTMKKERYGNDADLGDLEGG